MPRARRPVPLFLAAAALATAVPALASDGVLEISQACVANGCFPGDDPGWPVQVTRDGSYVLTGNLEVPELATTAIRIQGEEPLSVTVDLNGFHISGVGSCSEQSCGSQGTGFGIQGAAVRIANGSIEGMGAGGIDTFGAIVTDVRVEDNQGPGVSCSSGCIVERVTAEGNAQGIDVFGGIVRNSVVTENIAEGISIVSGLVEGNTVAENGVGILCSGASALANIVQFNDAAGIEGDGSCAYGQNHLSDNNGSDPEVTGGAVQLGPNLCNAVPCP